ncbi:HSP70-2 [Symbiodinium sp. CCMP2592]|nr:HSP70-2 [Symbiodinium sp. CCMP2592]
MGFAMRARQSGPPVAVGIDLGTSCCRIGLWRDGDVLIVPNERGCLATPNCIGFLDCTGPVVGDAAAEQAAVNLKNTIFAPQRLLGAAYDSPWAQRLRLQGPPDIVRGEDGSALYSIQDRGKSKLMRPEEVLAVLLHEMKRQVEQCLGVTVKCAVCTVPSKYGQKQRRALTEALHKAQLEVLALVKAPTSAAIAFSLTNPIEGPRNVLVLDFGACYCDFCLLTLHGKCLYERAVGSEFVDLDSLLVRFCLTDIKLRLGIDMSSDWAALLRLSMACESAKRKLSQWNQTRVNVEALIQGGDYCVAMSRSYFEEFCSRDIDSLMEIFDICLVESGLERDAVDVVLVGGSSRIPRFRRLVKDFFRGQQPSELLRPDHAAVLGAAVYAAALAPPAPGNSGKAEDSEGEKRPGPTEPEPTPASRAGVGTGMVGTVSGSSGSAGIYSFDGLRLEEILPWSVLLETSASPASEDLEDLLDVPCNEAFGPRPPRESFVKRPSQSYPVTQ